MTYCFDTDEKITCCDNCPISISQIASFQVVYACGLKLTLITPTNQSRPTSCPLRDITGWTCHPSEPIGDMPVVTTTASTNGAPEYITMQMPDRKDD